MIQPNYPLLFERRLLEKPWGARRLGSLFGLPLPAGKAIGESWELSDHPSGESRVRNGPLSGRTLRELMTADSRAVAGGAPLAAGGRFPLLVKLIDTSDRLSVQVHPDDAAAARLGERDGGKNEAWYVVAAEEGATLWVGLARGTSRDDLAAARTRAEFEACLEALSPKVGEAIAIPAGTIHAIGAGITLCEVQQTSDVTYRVYDWDRPASAARPLHREQSFAVARFDSRPSLAKPDGAGSKRAVSSRGWTMERNELPSPGTFSWASVAANGGFGEPASGAYRILVLLAGELELEAAANGAERVALRPGEAALVPAAAGELRGRARDANFLLAGPR